MPIANVGLGSNLRRSFSRARREGFRAERGAPILQQLVRVEGIQVSTTKANEAIGAIHEVVQRISDMQAAIASAVEQQTANAAAGVVLGPGVLLTCLLGVVGGFGW